MKSKDEYLRSIYAKRDAELTKRKKTISTVTTALCLAICFATIFAFIPKKFVKKTNTAETVNGKGYSDSKTLNKIYFEEETTLGQIAENYIFNNSYVIDESNKPVTNSVDVYGTIEKENGREDSLKTEIAVENPAQATTRQVFFGCLGEPFDPDKLINGNSAIAPENPPEDYYTAVTEPYSEGSASIDEVTIVKTTKAALRTSDEAIDEAIKFIPDVDAAKLIDEKTQVTVTRTSSGKTTYTVYFYTETKLYTVELNAITLEMIECKEKNTVTGDINYYSPAHFPETTAALPEYKPQ